MSNRETREGAPKNKSNRIMCKKSEVKDLTQAKKILESLKRQKRDVKSENLKEYAEVLEVVVDAVSRLSTQDDHSDTSITVPETIATGDSSVGWSSPKPKRNAAGREMEAATTGDSPFESGLWAYTSEPYDEDEALDRLLDQVENDRIRQEYKKTFSDLSDDEEYILEEPIDEVEFDRQMCGYEDGFVPIIRNRCDTIEEVSDSSVSACGSRPRSQKPRSRTTSKDDGKCACGRVIKSGEKCRCGLVWI